MILVLILSFVVSCAVERSIEQTITDFAVASNTNNFDLLTELLSEDSQWWTGRPTTIDGLLVYMNGMEGVSFSDLSISETGDDGTVNANAIYNFFGTIPFSVYFVMRRHDQTWKIKEYYDYVPPNDWAWLQLGRPVIVH